MALGFSVKECQACAELEAQDAGDGGAGGEVDPHSAMLAVSLLAKDTPRHFCLSNWLRQGIIVSKMYMAFVCPCVAGLVPWSVSVSGRQNAPIPHSVHKAHAQTTKRHTQQEKQKALMSFR